MQFRSLLTIRLTLDALLLVICTVSLNAHAAQPVTNGNFEKGDLSGWFIDSENNGQVLLADKGSCYSANDTTKVNIRGNFAALLKANSEGDLNSTAVMRSDAFNAGDGFAFIALSETTEALKGEEPTKLVVEILDASDDSVIASQTFSTGQANLKPGCPSSGVAGHFTSHYFSTRAFRGDGIKIQFKQSTRIKGSAFFTLIDQIVKFNQGEHPSFYSRPHAQAGMQITSFGTPMLTSRGSFDPDQKLFGLNYTWYVEGDVLELRNPCIDGLENGNHDAVLYVNDGHHAMSDSVSFFINQLQSDIPSSTDTGNTAATLTTTATVDTSSTVNVSNTTATTATTAVAAETDPPTGTIAISDPECDIQVAPVDDPNSYIVAVNDPDNLFVDTSQQTVVDNLTTATEQQNGQVISSEFTRNAFDLRASGIVFKPTSEGDGNLVVLTPSAFPKQTVSLLDGNENIIETANSVGRTNGDRETYRFSRPGSAYNRNIVLRVGNTDYLVSNPGARTN